jgi:pimeloyl-ACP methyl ester carboxylesterase
MPDPIVTEEPLQFGEGGRLFGILTSPGTSARDARKMPVFVFLSAGLLHRVGPYRLHVRLGRELARMGFSSLRVDLAGMGDSPPPSGLTYRQSISADFAEILGVLDSRLDRRPLVLAGLCTGADSAARLALDEPRVVGMILLDPICYPDRGFRARTVAAKYTDPARYAGWLKRRFRELTQPRAEKPQIHGTVDPLALRDLPSRDQLRTAHELIRERGGRVLSVFTEYAHGYYNKSGQLGRVLDIRGYKQFCTELYWPHAHHTYWLEQHRLRLIDEIKTWACGYLVRTAIDDPLAKRSCATPETLPIAPEGHRSA